MLVLSQRLRSIRFVLIILLPIAFSLPALAIPGFWPHSSIPIHRSTSSSGEKVHVSIAQQQHTNYGLKRLAFMTGKEPPSDYELLSLLYHRIGFLPNEFRQEYDYQGISEILGTYSAAMAPEAGDGHLSSAFLSHDIGGTKIRNSLKLAIESNDIGYIATIQIGTPPRNFRLLIDSGSADLWVGSEGCRNDDGGDCGPHRFLGPSTSKSFKPSNKGWAIGYGTGSVTGHLVQDEVYLAGLKLKGHKFGAALNESTNFTLDTIPFDGLIGLAKQEVSGQGVPTVLDSLFKAQLIPAPIVSYKIPRLADGKDDGEITFGSLNPSRYDHHSLVRTKNVNIFGFWEVAVNSVKVGHQNMGWANRSVVLDSGTTLLIVPWDDAQAIHEAIPGASYSDGGWMVPCMPNVTISLTIKGQEFSIDPRDLAFSPSGDQDPMDMCISGIGVGDVGPNHSEWIAGDVFLKNVYFSTDESTNTVSIARLRT